MNRRTKAHAHFFFRFLSLLILVVVTASFFSYICVFKLLRDNLQQGQTKKLQQVRGLFEQALGRGDSGFVSKFSEYLASSNPSFSDVSLFAASEKDFFLHFPNLAKQAEILELLEQGSLSSFRQNQGFFSLGLSTGFKTDLLVQDKNSATLHSFIFFARAKSEQAPFALPFAFFSPLVIGLVLIFSFLLNQKRMHYVLGESLGSFQRALQNLGQGPFNRSLFVPSDTALAPLIKALENYHLVFFNALTEARRQGRELEVILDSMGEGILILDTKTQVQKINKVAANLFGLDQNNVIGNQFLELIRSEALYSLAETVLDGKGPQLGELRLYRDKTHDLLVSASPIHNDTLQLRGVVLVLSDVTTLKRLEEIRKDFVANVSHELRTPITVLKGFAETLLELKPEDEENRQKFLPILLKNARRLEAIIDDLLTLSRLEQNGGTLGKEKVSFSDLIDSVIEICKNAAEEKNISLLPFAENGELFANRNLLEQALLNLVDNATKYCPAGSLVEISARIENNEAVFSVKDNGPGIPLKDQEHIFERFYRVDKARSRNSGGTGLGLSIVKHISLVHGGRAELESIPSKGTRFTLRFPKEPS